MTEDSSASGVQGMRATTSPVAGFRDSTTCIAATSIRGILLEIASGAGFVGREGAEAGFAEAAGETDAQLGQRFRGQAQFTAPAAGFLATVEGPAAAGTGFGNGGHAFWRSVLHR